jgi:hypothetical protein
MKKNDLYIRFAENVDSLINGIDADDYYRTHLFAYLEKRSVPSSFIEYVKIEKGKSISKSKDESNMVWGKRLFHIYTTGRTQINAQICKRFTEDLPSGRSISDLYRGIRKEMWELECGQKAKSKESSQRKYLKRKHGSVSPVNSECSSSVGMEQTKILTPSAMPDTWYPSTWLLFLLCSKPAGKYKHCLTSFNGGEPPPASMEKPVSRSLQRAEMFQRSANPKPPRPASVVQHAHKCAHDVISLYEKKLLMYERMNKTVQEIEKCQEEYLKELEREIVAQQSARDD